MRDRLQMARKHWPVGLIIAIFCVIATVYSLYLPLGEASDETDHFALVRFITDMQRPPLTQDERQAIGPKGDASPIYHGLVALLTQHVDVSALPELPETQAHPIRLIPTDGFRANRIFHTENESFPFRGIVLAWHLGRLVSIPLGAATILAVYLTALRIYPERRGLAAAAAGFAAFVPRFVIASATVSDDNLAIMLIAFTLYFIVRIAQGDQQPKTLILLGALTGGAVVVKNYSLVLLPEVMCLFLALTWQQRWSWKTLLQRCGYSSAAFLLVSGWWLVLLEVQFNQIEHMGLVAGLLSPLGDPVISSRIGSVLSDQGVDHLLFSLSWAAWVDTVFRSFWLTYGWLRVFAPPVVYIVLGGGVLLALVGLLLSLRESPSSPIGPGQRQRLSNNLLSKPQIGWRLDKVFLMVHLLLFTAVIVLRYTLKPAVETAQGRHLYPAMTAIALLFVVGITGICKLLIRWYRSKSRTLTASGSTATEMADRLTTLIVGGGLLGLTLLALPAFILPEYPQLPIRSFRPSDFPPSDSRWISLAPDLDLISYQRTSSPIAAGDEMAITLNWYSGSVQHSDYLIHLCLCDRKGLPVICRDRYPIDGRYPTRAWEEGYLIRDETELPIPACLESGQYELTVSLLPLQNDTAITTVHLAGDKDSQKDQRSLGTVTVTSRNDRHNGIVGRVDVWVGSERTDSAQMTLKQIRQDLLITEYWPSTVDMTNTQRITYFVGEENSGSDAHTWSPVEPGVLYQCGDGTWVSTNSFVVDASVIPGSYRLFARHLVQEVPSVNVQTRTRDFSGIADIPDHLNASFGNHVILLGYDIDRAEYRAGETIEVKAFWQSAKTTNRHYVIALYLVNRAVGRVAGQADLTLGAHYPSTLWAPGEYVEDVYALPVSHQVPAGLYDVEVAMYTIEDGSLEYVPLHLDNMTDAPSTEPTHSLSLGQVRIRDRDEGSVATFTMEAYLQDQVLLSGYDISTEHIVAGQRIDLALHWQAIDKPSADYTVFTQLIGPDGLVWAKKDNQPQGGRYPTSNWDLHSQVIDRYQLDISDNTPPGQYQLITGMYNLQDGKRLYVLDKNGYRLPNDSVFLTHILVE
jgi:hypothetical protein